MHFAEPSPDGPSRGDSAGDPLLLLVLRLLIALDPMVHIIIGALWANAAGLSAACARQRERALKWHSELTVRRRPGAGALASARKAGGSGAGRLVSSADDVENAAQLVEYMERRRTGFSANGWTISWEIAMNAGYPLLIAAVGIVLELFMSSKSHDVL